MLALAAFAAKMLQDGVQVINYDLRQGVEIIGTFYRNICPLKPEHEIATIAIKCISKPLGKDNLVSQLTLKGAKRYLKNYIQELA